jgi:uncharacterized protein (DUF2342 family)
MTGFNRIFESAQTLPRPEELADPGAWVARVHGTVAGSVTAPD